MFDIFLLAFVGQLHQRIQTFLINQDSQFSYGIVLPDKRLCFCHLRLIQTMKIIAQKESVNICGNAGPENLTKDHRLLSSSGHTEPTSYFVKEFNEAKKFSKYAQTQNPINQWTLTFTIVTMALTITNNISGKSGKEETAPSHQPWYIPP